MKINNLTINNVLGVKSAELDNPKPIILISGDNGSGKSSVLDAVSMALTGDLRRVSLKKDADYLINLGSESGSVRICVDDEDQHLLEVSKGKVVTNNTDQSPALPFVLDASRFASVTSDERRKLLFDISGCSITGAAVKQRLLNRGVTPDMADQVIPFLRLGFPEAQKEAQGKARDAKTSWRTISGETYGEKKAENWQAKVEGNLDEIREAIIEKEKELSTLNSDLEERNRKFGAAQSAFDKARMLNAEVVRLTDQAEKVDRIRSKLESDKQQAEHWREMVKQAKLATHGIGKDDTVCSCPECGAELIFTNGKLIPHGDLRGDEEAAVRLPEYERSLSLIENSMKNGERDLANAIAARDKLAILKEESSDAPDDTSIQEIKAKIDGLKAESNKLSTHVNELIVLEKSINQADATTAKAAEYHQQVQAWDAIAKALAPDGIPGEIIRDAIEPFVSRVRSTAESAGWPVPELDAEMDIIVSGRPYALLSESEKWRVDCLFAEAISYLSGLKIFVLDRFDVLDGASRGNFLYWLQGLGQQGAFDTVMVTGTLKLPQVRLIAATFDELMSIYWMDQGKMVAVEKTVDEEAA